VVTGAALGDLSAPRALLAAVSKGLLGTYVTNSSIWAATPPLGGNAPSNAIYIETDNPTTATLATLRTTILLVGAVAVLLSTGLGILLASRLSRELRGAAAVADRVAAGELDARVSAGGEDEVARLSNAIDAMAAALSERIERERRFAADVAHELRTPLTALVAAGELLGDERPAQIVRERVGALRTLVEDLLEISRLEQGAAELRREQVDLVALVRRVVDSHGLAAEVLVQRDQHTLTKSDPRRLERIVANLLENAQRHGAQPITVSIGERSVTVTDAGPGFPDELLQSGPVPFRTGATERGTGTGLGLVIAAAQAEVLGGRLHLQNPEGGGASATLELSQSEA
jgi:signal transduction histidine kinase